MASMPWPGGGPAPEPLRLETPMDVPGEGHPDWRPIRAGLRMRVLFDGPDGYRIALLHYGPGAGSPRHLHVGDEHLFVLRGSQRDEHGEYGPGDYLFTPAGTVHSVDSPGGCLALMHWRAPASLQVFGEKEGA